MFDGQCPPGCPCRSIDDESKAVKHVYEGKVVRDPNGFNGSPNVMVEGSHQSSDQFSGVASGTFHGRFLIRDEYVGKRIRITIEVEE